MNCDHPSVIKLTASNGKSRSFCADCLFERDAPKSSAPVAVPAGGFAPYSHQAAQTLLNGELTEWEQQFIPSLAKMKSGPTEKQMAIWTKIVKKYFPGGLPDSPAFGSEPASDDELKAMF